MSSEPIDSRTQSGGHLPATARSHALRYAERGHAASRGRDLKALAYYRTRSEEHTSELQSQSNLVCRLLLQKKNYSLWSNVIACCSSFRLRSKYLSTHTCATRSS